VTLDRYPLQTSATFLNYEFFSEGPKGRIKKVVRYDLRNVHGRSYFNLGFGDWNDKTKKIDDASVSDNGDRTKILRTVAETAREVTAAFPDIPVFAVGSSPARTRLYQMGISSNLTEIETFLTIWGFSNEEWIPFQKGINFDAFLVRRK
jgi:hypothetical protein